MAQTHRTDTALTWPECLGSFDEESCRFFLRELGQRIVQFYPFSVGIEEVYSHIVEEYGIDGAPDALSVLQELLEDDSTAAGAGDDGDIWRSWRHSWRHRNDSATNPYIPRVRGRILDPPTSVRIRLLKSANFITGQLNQAKDHASRVNILPSEPSTSQMVSRTSLSLSRSPSQIRTSQEPSSAARDYHHLLSHGIVRKHSPKVSTDSSQQDIREVTDERYLLPAQRYDPTPSTSVSRSFRVSTTDQPRKYIFPFNLTSPRRRSGTASPPSDQHGLFGVDMIPEEESSDLTTAQTTSPVRSPTTSALWRDGDLGMKQTPKSVQTGGDGNNRHSLPSDFGSTDREATPTRRRAAHRQARMIDGALFQGKSRKGKFIESDGIAAGSPVKKNENETQRLSGRSTKQHSRESWLHNVLTRFRGEHNRNSGHPKLRKRHSSLTSCGIIGSPRSNESNACQPDTPPVAEMKQTTLIPRFGFDGTDEEYHNKPLPLSPGELHRASVQSDIQRTFFGRTLNPILLSPSTAVSSASQRSHSLHKASDFAPLVSATMSGPHELSPKEKAWRYRLSTSTTRSGPPSPSSFSTFANKNPYHDSSEPSTPTVPAPAPLTYHKQKISSTEWPFRAPQDLQNHKDVEGARHGDTGSCFQDIGPNSLTEKAVAALHTGTERGRKPAAPIPQSISSDAKTRVAPPRTPPPRSRSPVKRLIGMVKSMSTNQISDNTPSSTQDAPNSTNKRKWKELSNKLRHGFLTADLEQLEQEEMMEQYSTNNDIQILTPPPSRQRPSFPVSIKSSGQSKLWSELEYMLIETCNTFLKEELANDRLSRESIIRAKRQWQSRNRPSIVEFYYDQATQYEIIIGNLRTIKLYSDYAEDAIMLNSVLHQWKILIRELSIKTLCMPDSIVRRWLHDGRRVLELLGASQITLAHLDRLSGLCFAVFGSAEKQRAKQRGRSDTISSHRRSASDGSQTTLYIHEQALVNNGTPGNLEAPPLPIPRSMGNVTRKVTPQEKRVAQQARKSMDRDRYISTGGNSFSRSFTPAEERARFALD